ncbi:MAG: right-handed parallel beta-helix repeat-containing protein [Chrysiogenetes bacterium]|nr:right-handed parallel beta-helix repeat-containing protein [Chrysiogenetes bacterium]
MNDTGDGSDFDAGDGVCEVTDGGGDCTLRAAIEETNQLAGADTVTFSVTGTITLGSALEYIVDDLTVTGPGQTALTVDLDGNVGAVFAIDSRRKPIIDGMQATINHQDVGLEKTLTLSGLTLTGSGGHDGTNGGTETSSSTHGTGGGVYVADNDSLVLSNCRVTGNESDQREDDTAAGINIGGNATIRNVMVDNNAFVGGTNPERAQGAGISIAGGSRNMVLLENVTVKENTTVGGGGGISIDGGDKVVSLKNVTVSDNTAMGTYINNDNNGEGGGGITLSGNRYTLILENVIVDGNMTQGVGGGIFMTGAEGKSVLAKGIKIINNIANDDGGGIEVQQGGLMKIYNSTISGNEAGASATQTGAERPADGTDSDYRTNIDTVDGQLTYSSGEDARFVHGVVPGTATIRVASNDNNANTVEAFTDGDMDGNLTGDDGGTGTIDYETGEWSITLNANPGNSNEIYLEYDIVLGNGGGVAVGRIFNEHNYGHAVHLIGTTITGNTAEVDGGGIYNGDGKVILSGSTVSGNTAGNLGGGVSVSQSGVTDDDEGGLMGTLFGQNSTISGNSAGGAHKDCTGNVLNLGGLGIGVTDGCTSTTTTNLFNIGTDFRGVTSVGGGGGCVLSADESGAGYGFVFLLGLAIAMAAASRRRGIAVKAAARKGGMLLVLLAVLAIPSSALAATFTVSDTGDGVDEDTGDDICEVTDSMGDCTLRAAIEQANATAGADTITFSVTGTITLGSGLPEISESLTITGPGAASLTLDLNSNSGPIIEIGNDSDGDLARDSQNIEITGLTLTGSGDEGALEMGGNNSSESADKLVLRDLIVEGNEDDDDTDNDVGGIFIGSSADIIDVIVRNNEGGTAGGIEISIAPKHMVNLMNVQVTDNVSRSGGGGIRVRGGPATINFNNVTATGNEAQDGSGGGMMVTGAPKNFTVANSTFSNNTAAWDGGGIYTNAGILQLFNVTMKDNTAGSTDTISNWDTGDDLAIGTSAYMSKLETFGSQEVDDGADVILEDVNWRRIDPGSVSINAGGEETFTDPGEDGVLVGGSGGTGTIDYATGEFSITLNSAAAGTGNIVGTFDAVIGDGGGMYAADLTEDNAYGGLIVEFNGLRVSGNTAMNAGGGISMPNGTMVGSGAAVTGNTSGGKAGGVYAPRDLIIQDDWQGNYSREGKPRFVTNGAAVTGNTAGLGNDCYGTLTAVGGIALGSATECTAEAVANYFGFGTVVSSSDCTLSPTESGSSMFILMSAVAAVFMVSRRRRSAAR